MAQINASNDSMVMLNEVYAYVLDDHANCMTAIHESNSVEEKAYLQEMMYPK